MGRTGPVGYAIPHFPGDFDVVNTTVINAVQFGDNTPNVLDTLTVFAATTLSTPTVAGGARVLRVLPAAHGTVVGEVNDVLFDAHTMTITAGFAVERFTLFARPTVTSVAALTIVDAATVAIANAPAVAGAAVITNAYSLWVQAGMTLLAGGLTITGPLTVNKGVADTVTINGLLHTGADDLVINETRASAVAGEQRAVSVTYTSPAINGLDALGDIAALYVSSFVGSASDVAGGLAANFIARHDAAVVASRVGFLLQNGANYGGVDGAGIAFDGDNAADIGAPVAGITALAHRGRPRTIYAGTSFEAAGAATLAATALTWTGVGNITAAGVSTWANGAFALTITGGAASIYEALDGALTVRTRQVAAGGGGILTLQAAAAITNGVGGNAILTAGAAVASAGNQNDGGTVTLTAGAAASAAGQIQAQGGSFTFNGGAAAHGGGAAGAANGGGFTFNGGAAASQGAGGGLTFVGGVSADVATSTGGAISLTSGASGGVNGTVGGITITTGALAGGTVGTITLGSTTSTGALLLRNASGNIRFASGSGILTTSATAFTADAGLTVTATAAALALTGGTTATLTATTGDVTLNPAGARQQVNVSGKEIFNARFAATQLHYYDDFMGPALDTARWATTLAGAGSVAMQVGGASVLGGELLFTVGASADLVTLHMGTNRAFAKSLTTTYEVRVRLSAITQTRVSILLHNGGATPNIAVASADSGVGYATGGGGDAWIGFEFIVAAGAGVNWRARSAVAGVAVVDIDTGVPPVANVYQTLRIELTPAGGATFYIDGVLVGTAVQFPDASVTASFLEVRSYTDNNVSGATTRSTMIDYIKTWQTRT